MSFERRLGRLEGKLWPSALQESTPLDMRSAARSIAFLLRRGIEERTGPVAEAALEIARLLKAAEEKRA